ncbi:hypothetical protein [Sphingomonas sp. PAMC 26621]|uniref:hypothetical protein n=1 Tax=Sphingomonas sp. PAMC 26621 TaxID=1112213 RepID=UPI000288C4C8|nr:hypothetical protein [Sphingomonas sp. PAMC 26621]
MTTLTLYDLADPHARLAETHDATDIADRLAPLGIRFERWQAGVILDHDASDADGSRPIGRTSTG